MSAITFGESCTHASQDFTSLGYTDVLFPDWIPQTQTTAQ